MMWLAWLGAAAIGLSLGLLGSGGSILTVPVLVYLVGQPEKVAIAGSLAIVGGISLLAALPWTLRRQVHWRSVAWFGIPGMAGTWLGAWASQWVSGAQQLLLFAIVMLAAAVLMFRPPARMRAAADADGGGGQDGVPERKAVKIAIDGLLVGIVTGLVGVGGGFLIVPALVLLGGLAVHRAIGTSLWIIALKSFSGFAKYMGVLTATGAALNWPLIGLFVVLGAGGSVVGGRIARSLPQARLQEGFAVFLVLMAFAIGWQTLPRAFASEATPATAATVHPSVLPTRTTRATPPTGGHAAQPERSIPAGETVMAAVDSTPRVPGYRAPRTDLLTGGQPDESDWPRLRRAGVTTVVNLRTAEEMAGRDAAAEARAAGLRYLSMPIDGAAGVTPAAARALWAQLESDADGATLVHCASGNRVGALLALGAAQAGAMAPEAAIEFGRAAGMTGLEDRVRELMATGTRR